MADSEGESRNKASASQFSQESQGDRTRVDLGDDLLEVTSTNSELLRKCNVFDPESRETELPSTAAEIDDFLQSAVILINEGIIEEAKKFLRRIILADPGHPVARAKLNEIHELELKQIFESSPKRAGKKARVIDDEDLVIDSEQVMRELDRDLKLGMFERVEAVEASASELSLFKSVEALNDFAANIDKQLASASAKDRIDVGIAFGEMGLYDLAVAQFRAANRDYTQSLNASALLAYSLILGGKPFDAVLCIEPVLGDFELSKDDKIEFLYLMGRAYEGLGKPENAFQWYQQVFSINANYRDAMDRAKAIADSRKLKLRNGPG